MMTADAPGSRPFVAHQAPVGADSGRHRFRLRYELLGCAFFGHLLIDSHTAEQSGHADLLYRDGPAAETGTGANWFRCLRCDAWLPLTPGNAPAPHQGPVEVPLRGRPLRDRIVLRLIAIDRVIHLVLIGAVAVAIFLFADHRQQLHSSFTRVLNRLQAAFGGPFTDSSSGLLHDFNELFAVSTGKLYLYGVAIAIYAAVNGIEAFGLWRARRWAEYLTLLEVAVFLPVEIHELFLRVSPLKVITLVLNLAVVIYLLVAHRLFGVRGGGRADQAEKDLDTGWEPLARSTPWARTA